MNTEYQLIADTRKDFDGVKNIFYLIVFTFFCLFVAQGCNNDELEEPVAFADANLLEALCNQGADIDGDGLISLEEAQNLTKITLIGENITNFGGLEAFTRLDSIVMKMLPPEILDLSHVPQISYLECTLCEIRKLDLSGNLKLATVLCEKNQLDTLLLPVSSVFKTLNCGYNRLRSIDVSANPALTSLRCNNNLLTSLNLSNNPLLTTMISCGNQLTTLDVSKNSSLTLLGVDNMPMLSVVYVWALPFPPAGVQVLNTFSPQIKFALKSS